MMQIFKVNLKQLSLLVALPHVGGLNLLCPFRKSRTATDTRSRDYHCVEYVFLFSLSNGISLRVLKRAFTICSTK
jgi:hypothetical protein